MPDRSDWITRRRALKAAAVGAGTMTVPTVAAGETSKKSYEEFKQRLDRLKTLHGRITDIDETWINESTPKKVRKTLVFRDDYETTILFVQGVETPNVAKWDGDIYRLEIEAAGTGFEPEPTAPGIQRDAVRAQAPSEWLDVTIGEDETFWSATHGRARTTNEWVGDAKADYDGTECQFATNATFLGIPGAYAQTWVSLHVNSASGAPDDKYAGFDISSSWDASWLGAGGSGAWKVGVYAYDYEAGSFIDKEVIAKAQVAPADFRIDRGSDTTTLGINLEAGKHYGVGIYAGGSSGAVGLQSSTVDLWPAGNFDGGARWSEIELNWS